MNTTQTTTSNRSTANLELPNRLRIRLAEYRRRVWFIKVTEAVLAAVFGALFSYLVLFVLDRFVDTSPLLRSIILFCGSVAAFLFLPLKLRRWVWNHRRLDQLARLISKHFPRFGDQLLGVIELAQQRDRGDSSPALVNAAIRQVDSALASQDLEQAIPKPHHRKWAWATATIVTLTVGLTAFFPDASQNAFSRWLQPWRELPRYTFAQLRGRTDSHVVPYAEAFDFNADLNPDSPWKPQHATAQIGRQDRIKAERNENSYRFALPPQRNDQVIEIRVGDARQNVAVEPKIRPSLIEIVANATLPDYLEIPTTQTADARGGTLRFVEGSSISFAAKATRNLAKATLDGAPQDVDQARIVTRPFKLENPRKVELRYQDDYGLTPNSPDIIRLETQSDAAPTITLTQRKRNRIVLSTELLAFDIKARDDFGLREIGLEWVYAVDSASDPTVNEKIVAAGGPEKSTIEAVATFSAEQAGIEAQTVRLRAFAQDYLPGRARAYSPYVFFYVLTPEDHYHWLTQQLEDWTSSAEEIYDRELRLNQINRELGELSNRELATAEQQARLREQAAAEEHNAAQLEQLVGAGKRLIQEATRNEEFTPQQLEALASMLLQLELAAKQQMPSVADLLRKASENTLMIEDASPTPGSTDLAQGGGAEANDSAARGQSDSGAEVQSEGNSSPSNALASTPPTPAPDPNPPAPPSAGIDRRNSPANRASQGSANPTPMVSDSESGFNEQDQAGHDSSPTKGGLGIPETALSGTADDQPPPKLVPKTAKQQVRKALKEQEDLLEAFRRLSAEMTDLLSRFENATFVKRLKASSRNLMDRAVELNDLDGFGLTQDAATATRDERRNITEAHRRESKRVATIQEDLLAYLERRPSRRFERVCESMQVLDLPGRLQQLSATLALNTIGQATIDSELWADTLDRWAEELVGPPPPHGPPQEGLVEIPNLTPEIVVEVLRIIDKEIALREQTREFNQRRLNLREADRDEQLRELKQFQAELAEKTRDLATQISSLPRSDHDTMQSHIKKLRNAAFVMDEVVEQLSAHETGPPTIAAISEVLEILLESVRHSNSPQVTKSSPTSTPALMLLGIANDEATAYIEERTPSQATGTAGRRLPEEYRYGLDQYLNALGK